MTSKGNMDQNLSFSDDDENVMDFVHNSHKHP